MFKLKKQKYAYKAKIEAEASKTSDKWFAVYRPMLVWILKRQSKTKIKIIGEWYDMVIKKTADINYWLEENEYEYDPIFILKFKTSEDAMLFKLVWSDKI